MEALYEKRNRKAAVNKPKEEEGLQVDRVDALPIKTLDGELQYRAGELTFFTRYTSLPYHCNIIAKYLYIVVSHL